MRRRRRRRKRRRMSRRRRMRKKRGRRRKRIRTSIGSSDSDGGCRSTSRITVFYRLYLLSSSKQATLNFSRISYP